MGGAWGNPTQSKLRYSQQHAEYIIVLIPRDHQKEFCRTNPTGSMNRERWFLRYTKILSLLLQTRGHLFVESSGVRPAVTVAFWAFSRYGNGRQISMYRVQ